MPWSQNPLLSTGSARTCCRSFASLCGPTSVTSHKEGEKEQGKQVMEKGCEGSTHRQRTGVHARPTMWVRKHSRKVFCSVWSHKQALQLWLTQKRVPARCFIEELLLTLHPVYPFTLVQGTGESGTLGWKQIFRSKMIGASAIQQLLFPIGWGHGKQLCSRKRNPDVFGSCSVDSHSATDADSLCTQHHWLQAAKTSRINPPICVSYGEVRALAINVHVSSHLKHTDTA